MALTSTQLEFRLADARSRLEQGRGARAVLEEQRAAAADELAGVRQSVDLWRQVQALLGRVSEFARIQLQRRLEETVTAALQSIFGEDGLRFEIELRDLGGRPAADWRVVSRYGETEVAGAPEDARGGGIVDVVSLALRLALLELSRPRPGGPVILDEPGKMISAEYAPALAAFLRAYAQRTGRQVVMVTHNAALAEAADRAFRVSQAGGISEVTPA